MKRNIQFVLVSIMLIFISHTLSSQTFSEVTGLTWGGGLTEPQPCFVDIDNDGFSDLLCGCEAGTILHYEQDSIGALGFHLVSGMFINIASDENSNPSLAYCTSITMVWLTYLLETNLPNRLLIMNRMNPVLMTLTLLQANLMVYTPPILPNFAQATLMKISK